MSLLREVRNGEMGPGRYITARKQSLQRLCFYRCLSVHKGRGVACMAGGMRGGSVHGGGGGMCVVGGMHGKGACMAGGVRGRGACVADTMRYGQ